MGVIRRAFKSVFGGIAAGFIPDKKKSAPPPTPAAEPAKEAAADAPDKRSDEDRNKQALIAANAGDGNISSLAGQGESKNKTKRVALGL